MSGTRASGRKKGVPNKISRELRAAAAEYTEEALAAIVRIARGKRVPAEAQLKAWGMILDRAHGKPVQTHNHNAEAITSLILQMGRHGKAD